MLVTSATVHLQVSQ